MARKTTWKSSTFPRLILILLNYWRILTSLQNPGDPFLKSVFVNLLFAKISSQQYQFYQLTVSTWFWHVSFLRVRAHRTSWRFSHTTFRSSNDLSHDTAGKFRFTNFREQPRTTRSSFTHPLMSVVCSNEISNHHNSVIKNHFENKSKLRILPLSLTSGSQLITILENPPFIVRF